MQPSLGRIHVAGKVAALEMPVTGRTVKPLYQTENETVFEFRAMPGRYDLYRIVRE